jgi:multidrug resistance efflux pump
MLELLLCSLFTIFPDYLFRRYVQGKRFGREINLYSVFFELRWGISWCLILTVLLITVIFYFHPATHSAVSFYRTIPILPEATGRVETVYLAKRDKVKAGQPIFKLDSSKQEADLETARRRVAEADAAFEQAKVELLVADGKIQEAQGALQQATDALDVKTELQRRNPGIVAGREIERLQRAVEGRQGGLVAAQANKKSIEMQISSLLPARKATAEAARDQAQVELDKTTVYAGVEGTVEQFTLRKGDIVNPLMRPAGTLIPSATDRPALVAGFGQIEAQIMKIGMIAEATCVAKPLTIIPMVVSDVQDIIAAGQIRPTDQLVDPSQATRPGTVTVFLEPLYKGTFDGIPPGSHCIANAYTNNHDKLADPRLGTGRRLLLHAIDAVAVVHAMILRLQALILPLQTLVFAGRH